MLGLHIALNKILHNRYLTLLWIKFFIIDISEGSEYASIYEYASVTQFFVEHGPSYFSGFQYASSWIYIIGYEYVRVKKGSV